MRRRPQVGTNFEPFTRHAATVAKGAIDTAVLNPRGATDVVKATLGNAAGIVGAAQLVRIG